MSNTYIRRKLIAAVGNFFIIYMLCIHVCMMYIVYVIKPDERSVISKLYVHPVDSTVFKNLAVN